MQFWYKNDSMEGLSALSLVFNFVCEVNSTCRDERTAFHEVKEYVHACFCSVYTPVSSLSLQSFDLRNDLSM